MYGALLGDRIGAPYEFDRGNKTKDFPLFTEESCYTDDSVMTIAVAQALMEGMEKPKEDVKKLCVEFMQSWGRRYPYAGYGGMFAYWLRQEDPRPYGSFGNGAAMRVSSAGWLYDSLEETRAHARWTAEVSHNHPEGIKGAEAIASAIFLAREGYSKEAIKDYICRNFGYDLHRTCDEIRPGYHHVETCQETVPQAITAFLEGQSLEDVFRTAVSLGGDCDTLTCIAGSIAEAFYGVEEELKEECMRGLEEDMREVVRRFDRVRKKTSPRRAHSSVPELSKDSEPGELKKAKEQESSQPGTEEEQEKKALRASIALARRDPSPENLFQVIQLLKRSFLWVPCQAILSRQDEESLRRMIDGALEEGDLDAMKGQTLVTSDVVRLVPKLLQSADQVYFPAFTSEEEMGDYGEGSSKIERSFLDILKVAENNEAGVAGVVINAFSEPFVIPREIFKQFK